MEVSNVKLQKISHFFFGYATAFFLLNFGKYFHISNNGIFFFTFYKFFDSNKYNLWHEKKVYTQG